MKKLYILGLIALAAIIIGAVWAEQITFTTYYPAPYGVYREMRATRMAIGDDYIDGGTYDWDDWPNPTIDPDADLVVQGNVGIGTTSPNSSKGSGGYLDAKDVYLRDTDTWASEGGGGFGDWVDMGSSETVHGPVATDGFVVVRSWQYNVDNRIYTDASPNPTTARFMSRSPHGGQYYGATIPVKKGHYWRVDCKNIGAVVGSLKIYWIPFGS